MEHSCNNFLWFIVCPERSKRLMGPKRPIMNKRALGATPVLFVIKTELFESI